MRQLIALTMFVGFVFLTTAAIAADHASSDTILYVHGKVEDKVGNPVPEAHVEIFLDGKPYHVDPGKKAGGHGGGLAGLITGHGGLFMATVHATPEAISQGNWAVRVGRPSFETSDLIPLTPINDEGIGPDARGFPRLRAGAPLSPRLRRAS